MGFQRQPQRLVILRHFLAGAHLWQGGGGLMAVFIGVLEQRQRLAGLGQRRPAGLAAAERDGAEGIGIGEPVHRAAIEARTAGQIGDAGEGTAFVACRDQARGGGLAHALDLAQAEAQGEMGARFGRLQRAVPVGMIDVGRSHLDAVLARIADQLRRGVKPHRLGIEDRGGEDVRVVVLQPAGDIDDQGETGGMAFRETVFAKALELFETALCEIGLIAFRDHALHQLLTHFMDRTGAPEGRHRAAQLVGFGRGETGGDNRDAHRLFLEKRHTERLAQHLLERP